MAEKTTLSKEPRETYLDGLRGLLSVAVFNSHLPPIIILGYDRLSGPGVFPSSSRNVLDIPLVASCVKKWNIFTIPVFKLLYSGSPAVAMFFGISGYVLSRSWVERQAATSDHQSRTDMGFSTFRRPLRIILASLASLVPPFFLCKLGYLDTSAVRRHGLTRLQKGYTFALDNYEGLPARFSTWRAQTCDLFKNIGRIFALFSQRSDKSFPVLYNPVLWTVKLDLRASLVLLTTQVALSDVRRPFRLTFLGILALLGVALGSVECPLFWSGWILAELHYSADRERIKNLSPPKDRKRRSLLPIDKSWTLLLGCYLASYPTWNPHKATMFFLLREMNFSPRTWHSLGAMLTLYSVRDVPWVRHLCGSRIAQFLGRHSFSIYLTHVCVIVCLGPGVFFRSWSVTGHENMVPFVVGFATAYTILLGIVVAVSVVFRTFVELPLNRVIVDLYRLASHKGSY